LKTFFLKLDKKTLNFICYNLQRFEININSYVYDILIVAIIYENKQEYLSRFLSYITEDKQKKECIIDTNNINNKIPPFSKNSVSKLSNLELSSLYNIGGYLLHSIKKTFKICDTCLHLLAQKMN